MIRPRALVLNSHEGQRDAAILDGGYDAVSVLRGGNAQRLLKHFGVGTDDDTPLTQAELDKQMVQLPKWQAFCSRDRWSENAIREGQKVMQAVMNGEIAI